MRYKRYKQTNITHIIPKNKISQELEGISAILDANPRIVERAYEDLTKGCNADNGREGMTAEQVVRSAILKQYRNLNYEELSFHLEDSNAFRAFARLGMSQYPCDSVLQENIKALSAETWESINRAIICYAEEEAIEKGRTIRTDSTAVETNIHHPTDSTLICDGVRIITRWLIEGSELRPKPRYRFSDHRRVVKKRVLAILNSRKEEQKRQAYKELLDYAGKVAGYAEGAIPVLQSYKNRDEKETQYAHELAEKLKQALTLMKQVIDQTTRRVMQGEAVPATEKVVSFFESHTDIIVKGRRETEYGHKIFLTGGTSNLILDCIIERGNPSDADHYKQLVARIENIYGRVPRQVTADGGFASKENLQWAKGKEIKDVAFSKKRGLSVLDMVKSSWVYKKLKNFRAGIEANISALKRAFGLRRCSWSGWEGFKQYVWSAIVSYNLLVLARHKIACT